MQVHRQSEQPRAFYPEYTDNAPLPAQTPGWDVGLERQIDDGRTLVRGVAWALTAMVVVASVATLGVMRARHLDEVSLDSIDRRYLQ